MHWSERIADEIISRNPNKEEYVCAAGISPSGSVHIGNFRDIATSLYVVMALKAKGKKAKLLFSWDDFDRLRKVPSNVAKVDSDFQKYIGMPYTFAPDPFKQHASYGEHFEREFEDSLKDLGVQTEFIYQTKNYMSGKYNDQIIKSLQNRKKIYDILMSFKTQDADEVARENYYPLNVYCRECKKDTTTVTHLSEDCEQMSYKCASCGQEESVKVREYPLIKLVWKVDWPMRWQYENVDFEPGGIDHAAASGSYVVSREIVKEIFGYPAPVFQGYGWLGIKGLGDMHSSSGMNLTPAQILKIYEPEMVRWLFAKYDPADSFNFCFDDTIIRHYSEFDKGVAAYIGGQLNEYDERVFEFSLFNKKETETKTSFGILASVAPIVDFNENAVGNAMQKVDTEFKSNSFDRLTRVKNWIETYQPQKMYKLLTEKNKTYFDSMPADSKEVIKKLYDYLSRQEVVKDKEIQQYLYDIINNPSLSKKENTEKQISNFKHIYNLMFGMDEGPRLYLFFAASDKHKYLDLLNF